MVDLPISPIPVLTVTGLDKAYHKAKPAPLNVIQPDGDQHRTATSAKRVQLTCITNTQRAYEIVRSDTYRGGVLTCGVA